MLASVLRAVIGVAVLLAWSAAASAQAGGDIERMAARIDVEARNAGKLRLAGARVSVRGNATGDAWVAGAIVDIDARLGDDLWAAGSRVSVRGSVGGDATIAAGELSLAGIVNGELSAGGAAIEIMREARLGGAASLSGAEVTFQGSADRALELKGDTVIFAGTARGPVTIDARHVRFTETARAEGTVTVYSLDAPEVAPGVQIGSLVHHDLAQWEGRRRSLWWAFLAAAIPVAAVTVTAFLLGTLGVWLARGAVEEGIDTQIAGPGRALLLGLVAVVVLAVGLFLLAVTVIGLPLALALLLAMPLVLLLAYASSAFALGERLLNAAGRAVGPGRRIWYLAVGLVVLLVLCLIPFVGPLFFLLAVLMGLGALLRTWAGRLRPPIPPLRVARGI